MVTHLTLSPMMMSGVPYEFVTHFNPAYLVLVGAVLPGEDRLGFMKLRLKKHRWYKKILKTNDPLILSAGWRRFQTTPVYCIEDHNGRQRMIKYTPQHLHCITCCYGNAFSVQIERSLSSRVLILLLCLGPLMAPGIGFLGMQSVSGITVSCPNHLIMPN